MGSVGNAINPNRGFSDKVKKVYNVTPGQKYQVTGVETDTTAGAVEAIILLAGSNNYVSKVHIQAPTAGSPCTFQLFNGSSTTGKEIMPGTKYLVGLNGNELILEDCPNIDSGSLTILLTGAVATYLVGQAVYRWDNEDYFDQ